jgi:hypothetical protein
MTQVKTHGTIVRCSMILACLAAHALALGSVAELGKNQLPLPPKQLLGGQSAGQRIAPAKQIPTQQGIKSASSLSSLWLNSHTSIAALVNYFIQRMLLGGLYTQITIFIAVASFFISCGALLIWLVCWDGTCSLQYAMLKSYMLLFRYAPSRGRLD